jgi:hypothetical protein
MQKLTHKKLWLSLFLAAILAHNTHAMDFVRADSTPEEKRMAFEQANRATEMLKQSLLAFEENDARANFDGFLSGLAADVQADVIAAAPLLEELRHPYTEPADAVPGSEMPQEELLRAVQNKMELLTLIAPQTKQMRDIQIESKAARLTVHAPTEEDPLLHWVLYLCDSTTLGFLILTRANLAERNSKDQTPLEYARDLISALKDEEQKVILECMINKIEHPGQEDIVDYASYERNMHNAFVLFTPAHIARILGSDRKDNGKSEMEEKEDGEGYSRAEINKYDENRDAENGYDSDEQATVEIVSWLENLAD